MLSYTRTSDPRPAIFLPDTLAATVPAVATALDAWRTTATDTTSTGDEIADAAKAADAAITANRATLRTAALSQLATAQAELVDALAAIQPAREKVAELHAAARALDV